MKKEKQELIANTKKKDSANHFNVTADVLEDVVHRSSSDKISIEEITVILSDKGIVFLMFLFILPLVVPFPYPPGVTSILILPIVLFSLQMIIAREQIYLPKFVKNMSIKRSTAQYIVTKSTPHLRKIDKLIKQRFFFLGSVVGKQIFGLIILLFSISVAIPLPLTNLLPSWGILFMSIGFLSRDGAALILGIITGIGGIILTIIVIKYGLDLVKILLDFIK